MKTVVYKIKDILSADGTMDDPIPVLPFNLQQFSNDSGTPKENIDTVMYQINNSGKLVSLTITFNNEG